MDAEIARKETQTVRPVKPFRVEIEQNEEFLLDIAVKNLTDKTLRNVVLLHDILFEDDTCQYNEARIESIGPGEKKIIKLAGVHEDLPHRVCLDNVSAVDDEGRRYEQYIGRMISSETSRLNPRPKPIFPPASFAKKAFRAWKRLARPTV